MSRYKILTKAANNKGGYRLSWLYFDSNGQPIERCTVCHNAIDKQAPAIYCVLRPGDHDCVFYFCTDVCANSWKPSELERFKLSTEMLSQALGIEQKQKEMSQ